jgi:hypothetical protein
MSVWAVIFGHRSFLWRLKLACDPVSDQGFAPEDDLDVVSLQHEDDVWEFGVAEGDEVGGPVSGTGSTGVWTVTLPILETAGQESGFASKTWEMQAFWIVVRRAGSCLGKVSLASLNQGRGWQDWE